MTQSERVLKASRSYWGVCQADYLSSYTPDGGPMITRVPARIQDLEAAGYVFEITGWRNKTKVFRLVSEPDGVERDTVPGTPAGSQAPHPHRVPDRVSLNTDTDTDTLFETSPRGRSFANQENEA